MLISRSAGGDKGNFTMYKHGEHEHGHHAWWTVTGIFGKYLRRYWILSKILLAIIRP